MLAELPRKNCWTIAEHAGDSSPHGMQHLLSKAVWDTDQVAADLRDYVIEHLGEPDGVLVADETGDLKKGERTVGVPSRRGWPPRRSRCSVSTPGPQAGSRTLRSRST
jgi:SRSO17 transposase